MVQANVSKISTAMEEFRRWARERHLQPSATAYVAPTRDHKRERLAERQNRPPELLVIASTKPWTCAGCGAE